MQSPSNQRFLGTIIARPIVLVIVVGFQLAILVDKAMKELMSEGRKTHTLRHESYRTKNLDKTRMPYQACGRTGRAYGR